MLLGCNWGAGMSIWIFQTAVSSKPAGLGGSAQNEKFRAPREEFFSFWAFLPKPAGLEDTAL